MFHCRENNNVVNRAWIVLKTVNDDEMELPRMHNFFLEPIWVHQYHWGLTTNLFADFITAVVETCDSLGINNDIKKEEFGYKNFLQFEYTSEIHSIHKVIIFNCNIL